MRPLGGACPACGRLAPPEAAACPRCGAGGLVAVPDWYGALDCPRDVDPAGLKDAFRRLAKAWHPDRSPLPGARERFIAIATAFQVLADPAKRRAYDRLLAAAAPAASGFPQASDAVSAGTGDVERWTSEADAVSRAWSEERFDRFARALARVEDLVGEAAERARRALAGDRWRDRDAIAGARLVGAACACLGFWAFVLGALPAYWAGHWLARRNPGGAATIVAVLRLAPLVMVLVWLLLVDRLPAVLHVAFWLDLGGLLWLLYAAWPRHQRETGSRLVIRPPAG